MEHTVLFSVGQCWTEIKAEIDESSRVDREQELVELDRMSGGMRLEELATLQKCTAVFGISVSTKSG